MYQHNVVKGIIYVMQGSVLGPVLFNCVMSLLVYLLEDMGVLCHIYADDIHSW